MDPRQNVPNEPDPQPWYQGERGRPEPEWDRWVGGGGEPGRYGEESGRYGDERYRVPQARPGAPGQADPMPPGVGSPGAGSPGDRSGTDRPQYGGVPLGAPGGYPSDRTAPYPGARMGDATGEMRRDDVAAGRHLAAPVDLAALRRGGGAGLGPGAGFGPGGPGGGPGGFGGPGGLGGGPSGAIGSGGASGPGAGSPVSGAGPAGGTGADPWSRAVEAPGGGVYRARRSGIAAALAAVTVLLEFPALRGFAGAAFASRVIIGEVVASSLLIMALPMFAMGMYGLITGAAATPGQGIRVWLRTPLAYLPVALVLFVAAAVAVP